MPFWKRKSAEETERDRALRRIAHEVTKDKIAGERAAERVEKADKSDHPATYREVFYEERRKLEEELHER